MVNKLIYADAINEFLKESLPDRVWLGVFPRNKLPFHALCSHQNESDACKMLVLNLDDEDEPGSHFIAMVCFKKVLYVYDSFGSKLHIRLLQPGLSLILDKYKLDVWTNSSQHQSYSSNTCGYFCVWFLLEFYVNRQHITPTSICRVFVNDLKPTTSKVNESIAVDSIASVIEQQEYSRMLQRLNKLINISR